MKTEYRSDFSVVAWLSDASLCDLVRIHTEGTGYQVKLVVPTDDLMNVILSEPPHVILIDILDVEANLSLFKQIKEISPETLFVAFSTAGQLNSAFEYVSHGLVFDTIFKPVVGPLAVLQTLDRACERHLTRMQAEELEQETKNLRDIEQTQKLRIEQVQGDCNRLKKEVSLLEERHRLGFSGFEEEHKEQKKRLEHQLIQLSEYFQRVTATTDLRLSVSILVEELHQQFSGAPVVFFKFVPGHYLLAVADHRGFDDLQVKGLGLDLKALPRDEIQIIKTTPDESKPLKVLVESTWRQESFRSFPVFIDNEFHGLCVLMTGLKNDLDSERWEVFRASFQSIYQRNLLVKNIHQLERFDRLTMVLNRHAFMEQVELEIKRARRLQLPVSLVVFDIDHFSDFNSVNSREMGDTVLKFVASLLKTSFRANDYIGRLGADDFVLLLPHTPIKGAAIKAERLRRRLNKVDFPFKGLKIKQIAASFGVSEYPRIGTDAETLMQSADEALFTVKNQNRTCVASPQKSSEPDFAVDPSTDIRQEEIQMSIEESPMSV